ncbi:MAG: aldehyde dehydrogenase family protein, partial [Candidatus Diapherotrites archaeon]|nr:aldehyde dehydrogenase family protein [Candidatus Diapherotrites archaeon]
MDCKMLIDGQWVKSSSGEVFYDYAPATRKVIATFPAGNAADVDKAAKSAARAFPAWNRVPAPKRADILLKAALIMEKRKKELGQLVTQEMGKVWFEAEGDVQEAIDVLEYMAGEGRRMFGHTTPSELKDKFCMTVRRPIGVVGVITPWNFPFAIPAWKLAPALVCGNTIVFKPASD